MSLSRTYEIKCDGCAKVHMANQFGYSTPRRARAAARHDGWQRRTVVVRQTENDEWGTDADGWYRRTGRTKMYEERAARDFCEDCAQSLDAMEVGV